MALLDDSTIDKSSVLAEALDNIRRVDADNTTTNLESKRKWCPNPHGRPAKLTAETHQRIVDLIRAGATQESAALSVGISSATLTLWKNRGERELNLDPSNKDSQYAKFFTDLQIAASQLENSLASKWVKITTEPTKKVKRVYKEQVVNLPDGGFEIVKVLDSETIEESGDGNWQGISEFLLRRFNKNWGRREGVELTGKDGQPIEVANGGLQVEGLSLEAKRQILEILARERERERAITIEKNVTPALDPAHDTATEPEPESTVNPWFLSPSMGVIDDKLIVEMGPDGFLTR